jgi:hypothetical protein
MAKPFTLLKLDKEYEFRLTNKAGFIFEEVSGKSFTEFANGMGVRDMNLLVYAGLKCIDKEMTVDKVVDLIDEHIDFEDLAGIITKAMEQSTFFNKAKTQAKETHPATK